METSFLGGTSIGDIDIVVAGSYQDGATSNGMNGLNMCAGLTHNGGSNPGSFIVPIRDENGNLAYGANGLPSTRQLTDPSCGRDVSADQNAFGNSAWGNPLGNRCFRFW